MGPSLQAPVHLAWITTSVRPWVARLPSLASIIVVQTFATIEQFVVITHSWYLVLILELCSLAERPY